MPDPLSILMAAAVYPPVVGGAETHAQRLAAGLRFLGHDVEVVASRRPEMPQVAFWRDPFGTPVTLIRAHQNVRISDSMHAAGVCSRLLARRWDIVHWMHTGLFLFAGLPLSARRGCRNVLHLAGHSTLRDLPATPIGRLEMKELHRWMDCLLLLNDAMGREAKSLGFDDRRLVRLPGAAVDCSAFSPPSDTEKAALRQHYSLDAHQMVYVFAGRLVPSKRVDVLIEAFRQIRRSLPAAVLLIAGDGPAAPELLRAAAPLGGSVRFMGRVLPADIPPLLKCADVFVFASEDEGLSCSVVEAMATALPAVVSAIPANAELIDDGFTGLLIPPGSADGFADACLRLATNPAERLALGAAAREAVLKQHSIEATARGMERIYRRILAQPAASGGSRRMMVGA